MPARRGPNPRPALAARPWPAIAATIHPGSRILEVRTLRAILRLERVDSGGRTEHASTCARLARQRSRGILCRHRANGPRRLRPLAISEPGAAVDPLLRFESGQNPASNVQVARCK